MRRNLNAVRAECLESFVAALQPLGALDHFSGSAQPGLKSDFIRHFPVFIPNSTAEQSRIAAMLDTVHELVHLQEPHHGPGFWESLGRALPHWRQRKEEMQSRAREFLTFGLGTLA